MKDSISGTGNPTASISVERLGPIGFLVLSKPATLNALTLYMIEALHAGLQDLEADTDIALIVIRSSSDRAFCAGGDMKRIRQYCIDENFDAVERCLRQYAGVSQHESDDNFRKVIDTRAQWFADDNLNAIRQRLRTAATDDAIQLLTLLDSPSPHSLQITCDLFRQALGQDLATCLKLEYAAAQSACRHPDLVEGVRTVLIDKDRNPSWL